MPSETKQIVDKAWAFAHVLREEGLSYLAYTEQITFLLFLKMAHEIAEREPRRAPLVPSGWGWDSLTAKTGPVLKEHYDRVLEKLSRQPGMLGDIFRKPRPEIENPRTLRRLIVDLVGGETWTAMDADVKGDIYEGLLARTAAESPRGAGQYFTPRGLIAAIVDCVHPTVEDTVCDPAAGTGGFLLAAHAFASKLAGPKPARSERNHLSRDFVHGWELVPNTARLCVMNLYLHGVDADPSPLHAGVDSLAEPPSRRFSVVLTNPPFGKKGAFPAGRKAVRTEEEDESGLQARPDLWVVTANKQLNFLQHVYTLLESGGRCAIVVPDNVLSEAGAGEVVRRKLFERCNVHTLLRLPPGIFYAQGVKANVLFFDREQPPRSAGLWVYDLRKGKHFTLRQKPMLRSDLDEFVECYSPQELRRRRATWSPQRPQGRWRRFDHDVLLARDKLNLDLTWLGEEERRSAGADLPPSHELAATIADELRVALEHFQRVSAGLSQQR
jgi:type I restriction enzyme M protein